MMKSEKLYKMMFMTGLIFVIYGLLMLCYLGLNYFFNYFFFVWGIVIMLTAFYHELIIEKLGKKVYTALRIVTLICLSVFLIVEIIIFSCSFSRPEKNASVIIVLGSGVGEDGSLSRDFKARLDKCLAYYQENGGVIVVTGKKGRNEPIAEALAAEQYLLEKVVRQSDIRVDDQSKNTYENINNAYELTKDIKIEKTVIVSSAFHLYRARYLAQKIGFENVSLAGSAGNYAILPHYYAREFFALVKDFISLNW